MDLIYVGKITSTHGIKGELKVLSDFEKKDLIFTKDFPIYIDNTKHIINSSRIHQNKYLITIDSLYNINDVLQYITKDIYVNRSDLKLDTYLMNDLINYKVMLNNKSIGKVSSIMVNKQGYLLYIDNLYYIPFLDNFIINVDTNKQIINVKNVEGLIL